MNTKATYGQDPTSGAAALEVTTKYIELIITLNWTPPGDSGPDRPKRH
ncbi:MAG: hypothetical protein JO232_18090 [Verrucomicrobia bacterium]|nr:hypothetical protein [Verrucomicrobiota bacterium]